jgi:membrane protein DedA with SNARE-associated domain
MDLVGLIGNFKYPAIFLGSLVEGPVVVVATGFLINKGYFHIVPAFTALLLGDIAADYSWYGVGYFGIPQVISRCGKYIGFDNEVFERVRVLFARHGGKILIISKMTMGLGFGIGVLMAAGTMRVPLGKYGICSALGASVWITFLLAVGRTCGDICGRLEGVSRVCFVAGVTVCLLLAIFGLSQYIRKRSNM